MAIRAILLGTIALLGAAAPAPAGDEAWHLVHQGVERQAVLYRPDSLKPPAPLVVALHGLGQSIAGLRGEVALDAAADRGRFFVLYPAAIDRAWSYGRPINQDMPKAKSETADDVGFIRELVDRLVTRGVADPLRLYVTGASRGGLMTYTIACALADRFAAAAPLISGMTDHQRDDCHPSRPVPIMVLAGTDDDLQAYDGGLGPQGRLLSVPETMEFWRTIHGCTAETARMLPHRDPADPTAIRLVEWSGCKSGARLLLYRVDGGGHRLPSPGADDDRNWPPRFGRRNGDIDTAETVWNFFKGYTR